MNKMKTKQRDEITSRNCYFCNSEPKNKIGKRDNTLGYTVENTIACCKYCLVMKGKLDIDQYVDQLNKIFSHFINIQIKQQEQPVEVNE